MSKTTFALSFGYWFSAYSLGLLIHPYKTVREIVRQHGFRPLLFLPLVLWVLMWIMGLIFLHIILYLATFWQNLLFLGGKGWIILFWWITLFLLEWQIILIYLGFRFERLFQIMRRTAE